MKSTIIFSVPYWPWWVAVSILHSCTHSLCWIAVQEVTGLVEVGTG